MVNILYFGDDHPGSTSCHRALALKRLGHSVSVQNPAKAIGGLLGKAWLNPFHYRSGYRLLQPQIQRWLEQVLYSGFHPDLIWVNSGELLGPQCLKLMRKIGCPLVLYNNDDPTGNRDGRRFDLLLRALPFYDLCVIRRQVNIAEYKALGARRVLLVYMSYDEEAHLPFGDISEIQEEFRSEVAFVGTWMRYERRDSFMLKLIRDDIPLSIWGGRWEKSPLWNTLKPYYRGGALSGRDYVAAMQGSKLCLGLLSKGNRDLHTRRSVEVPFAGGLLCAERTHEHEQMYEEGIEAIFWSDATECAEVCRQLLVDDAKREVIRNNGMQRVRKLGVGNEDVCRLILQTAFQQGRQDISANTVLV